MLVNIIIFVILLCHSEQREESVCKNECNQILHCVQDDMRFNIKSQKAITESGFLSPVPSCASHNMLAGCS